MTSVARRRRSLKLLAALIGTSLFGSSVLADTIYWDGTGTGWDSVGSWSTGIGTSANPAAIPGALDIVTLSTTTPVVASGTTINLNGPQAALGIATSAGNIGVATIRGGGTDQTLSIGSGGISLTNNGMTIGSATAGQRVNISLTDSQTWNSSGAGQALFVLNGVSLATSTDQTLSLEGFNTGSKIDGVISESSTGKLSIVKNGTTANVWTLNGANTFTGGVTINAGILRAGNASAFGTGAITINGGSIDAASALTFTTNNAQNWNADFSFTGTANLNLGTGAVTMNAARTVTTSNNTLTVGGVISGTGSINALDVIKAGAGGLTLSNAGTITVRSPGQTVTSNAGLLTIAAALNTSGNSLTVAGAGNTTLSGIISDTGSVTKNDAGLLILSGNNSYSGGTILNAGILRANNAAAFGTGTLTINGGSLDAASVLTLSTNNAQNWAGNFGFTGTAALNMGTGAVTLAATRTVTTTASTLTVGGVISGAGGIVKAGAGTLALTGTNLYTGKVQVNAGTLAINVDANLGAVPGAFVSDQLTLNGGTLSVASGSLDPLRGISLTANSALTLGATGNFTTGVISGTGQLTVTTGTGGNYTPNVQNTYSGGTVLNAGASSIIPIVDSTGSPGAVTSGPFGTGTVTFNGATFRFTTGGGPTHTLANDVIFAANTQFISATGVWPTILSGPISITANRTITQDSVASFTFSNVVSDGGGNFSFTKAGTGQLILNGLNTYGGITSITAGTLTIGNVANGNLPSALGQSNNTAASLVLGSGTTLQYSGSGGSTDRLFTLNAATGSLDASGTGTVNFTNNGNVAWGTIDAARTLTLTGSNTGLNTLAPVLANNGTGAVALTKSGTGTWLVSGNNSYTGATTLSSGAIVIGNKSAFGTSTVAFNGASASATSDFTGANAVANSYTFTTGQIFQGNSSIELNAAVTLGASKTLNNDIISGKSLTLSGSSLLVGANSTTSATLTLGGTGTTNITGALINNVLTAGTSGLNYSGSGTAVLSGANTITGTITASSGTLRADYATNPTIFSVANAVSLTGGTLEFLGNSVGTTTQNMGNLASSTDTGLSRVRLDANGGTSTTVNFGTWTRNAQSFILLELGPNTTATTTNTATNGVLGNTGGNLIKDATGRYDFASLSGTTIVALNATTNLLGTGGSTTTNYKLDGSLSLTGNSNGNAIRINTTGTGQSLAMGSNTLVAAQGLMFVGSNDYTISATTGNINNGSGGLLLSHWGTGKLTIGATLSSGNGVLVTAGTGLIEFTANSNTTGRKFISGITARLSNSDVLGSGANTAITANGIIELTATSGDMTRAIGTAANQIQFVGNGGGFGAFGSDQTVNFGGAGAAVAWGTTANFLGNGSTLQLSSATSNAKITFANALNLGTANRIVNVNNGSANVDAEISGVISGTTTPHVSAFTKTGAGTLVLSNANTYTGVTNVTAGTLLVNGSLTSSAATVSSGATLGGSGSIGGGVTVQSGGILSPGNSPGSLAVGSGLTLAGGSIFNWENNTNNDIVGTAGSNWDRVVVTGTTTISNTPSTGAKLQLQFTNAGTDFTNSFWDTSRTYASFINGGVSNGFDISNISIYVNGSVVGSGNTIAGQGSFITQVNGSNLDLVWQAIASGNNSQIMINGGTQTPATGASSKTIALGSVFVGLEGGGTATTATQNLDKTGSDNTNYQRLTFSGDIASSTFPNTSTPTGPNGQTLSGTITMNVGTSGNKSGTVTIDNLASDSFATGLGSGDANDVFTVTQNVFQKASLTIGISSNNLTLTNAMSSDSGQRAGITVTGFSLSNAAADNRRSSNFSTPTVSGTGTVGDATTSDVTATVGTFALKLDRLNNASVTYRANVTPVGNYTDAALAALQTPSMPTILITANQTGAVSTPDRSGSISTFGAARLADIANGDTLAGYSSTVAAAAANNPNPGDKAVLGTTATIVSGTAASDLTLSMAWRARTTAEADLVNNPKALLSDAVQITGLGSETYLLTMTYDLDQFPLNENAIATSGELQLAWYNGTAWVNAIAGNTGPGNTPMFAGISTPTGGLGSWGIDTSGNGGASNGKGLVWAYVNHNGDFAVIPEPSTLVLGGLALLGFAGVGLRRRRLANG